ncbi:MAG: Mur ligase domain-containing protein, partial [Phycisphaeraceae bacterium]|nr:Mur ligase domain-containing protein [Phycisphaeraceae bacterium]
CPMHDIAPIELSGRHVHFVGIGGCGMSGLARLVRDAGAVVTGSDRAAGATIDALRADGIDVVLEQTADTVPPDTDLVVASAAIDETHPEIVAARKRDLPVQKYAQLLGALMAARRGVAIAGTHGKSTTTSLLSHILIEANLDPSLIVGAHCPQIGGGWRSGGSDLLVAEACEFDRSFHHFAPGHAVILNIEADHLDIYDGMDEIVDAFAVFAGQIDPDGSLLIQHESPHRLAVSGGLACRVQTIGFAPQADWQVVIDDEDATPTVQIVHEQAITCRFTAPMPGDHMSYNAAAAAVTAHRLGAEWNAISSAVTGFTGLDRRMQRVGERSVEGGEVLIIDDYGHHPTEIDTTLRALR